ncbi:hypothetical protein PGT21_030325 [Puccinia graminis f. sp. tritici]|uniref:Uncharacterized protein n=1 Tax=Puccinia graminis f. sp. tritici TaxID=56615 RepID=A0A5B0N5N5_PUCGR|nr:hypothetical protein PGT21_030325 [Puccinia graminis f. sp. tritici]KAA1099238.1 hypothetical protein PGTUg99_024236 [Puccinia graminis f. sp. tritici]
MVDESNKRATRSNQQRSKDATGDRDNLSGVVDRLTEINTAETEIPETNEELIESESEESDTFKEFTEPEGPKEKYKTLLSHVPDTTTLNVPAITLPIRDETRTDELPSLTDIQQPPPLPATKSDRLILWEKISEAVAANDRENADFFIRLYAQLNGSDATNKPDLLRCKTTDAVSPVTTITSSKKATEKTSIIFVRGSLPKHFDVGFTPFFDKNIKELRGPIPLTIFDKKWQEDAIQFHTNKRSKGDEKDGNYTGFEYPNEWTQTFAKWTANHRNFHVTFRDMYNYPDFAVWILEHKANVDRIIAEDGFLVGFRYDLIIRQNAFSYQVETDQGTSAVDISIFRKEVKREAWKVTRNLEELDYSDNPYAFGGEKFNFDPQTGKPRIPKGKHLDENHQISENRYHSRGRGGFKQSRGSDRFQQERRNSDYGTYRDDSYGHDYGGGMKRQREVYPHEDAWHGKPEGSSSRGTYPRDRGGFGRDKTFRGSNKADTPKGKEKESS